MLTASDLRQQERYIQMPLTLSLSDAKTELVCREILRLVPGKRLVARASFGNHEVIAKIFFSQWQPQTYAQHEIEGLHAVRKAGLLTPDIIYKGEDQSKTMYAIIFEKLHSIIDLNNTWRFSQHEQTLFNYLNEISKALAKQHEVGIIQNDVHLDNFIFTTRGLYTIDGSDIDLTEYGQKIQSKRGLKNLAKFFSILSPSQDQYREQFIDTYRKARDWPKSAVPTSFILNYQKYYRLERDRKKLNKIFRNCSAYIMEKSFAHFMVCDRHYYQEGLQQLLLNPDQGIEECEIIKDGHTCTVAKIKVDAKTLIIKRYNIKGFFHFLKRLFQPSRAAKSWRGAHYLQNYALLTCTPVCMLEERFGPFRIRSYLITEYLPGKNLEQYLLDPKIDAQQKEDIIKKALTYIKNLHLVNLAHGDMKASNFIVNNDLVYLIDLDGLSYYFSNKKFKHAQKKDWDRFMKNWKKYPELYEKIKALNTF